ncbi:conserved protein of unknown function [Rhodovastum atsumiense]|nr:conserved protein of unknown function [Rhodovastum atsumiense]
MSIPSSRPPSGDPGPVVLPDLPADALPEPDPDVVPVLAAPDYSCLKGLARSWRHPEDPVKWMLTDKLGRCRVVPPDAVSSGVAVLGARVIFAGADGVPESRVLVTPGDDAREGFTLCVTTPVGAALLGASVGQSVEAAEPGGRRVVLCVLAVHHDPGPRLTVGRPSDRRTCRGKVRRGVTYPPVPQARHRNKQGGAS